MEGRKTVDIHVNDVLKMKKAHPCGSQEWLVLRVGMDFKMRCQGCGHEVMLPRSIDLSQSRFVKQEP